MASPEHDDQPVVSSSPPPDTGTRIPVSRTWADARMKRAVLSTCVQTRRFRRCDAPSAAPVPSPSSYAPPKCRPGRVTAGEQHTRRSGASGDSAEHTQAEEACTCGNSSAPAGRDGTHRVPRRSCRICRLCLLLQRRELFGRELLQEGHGRSAVSSSARLRGRRWTLACGMLTGAGSTTGPRLQ